MPRIGVILINIGSPTAPRAPEVRAYLRKFLMDPYVVDIPALFRWLLVHAIVLPRRPALSARAYAQIWRPEGSPLIHFSNEFRLRLADFLDGRQWSLKLGMRYSEPSIRRAIEELREEDVTEIVLFPLYPQFSLAATRSSIEEARRLAAELAPGVKLRIVEPFYDRPEFIDAFAAVAHESLAGFDADFVLFSFHGLPERQMRKADRSGSHCLARTDCCERIADANRDCYRAQAFASARLIASALGLSPDRYSVSFQSRLGRSPWIGPYTDFVLPELAAKGVRRLAVISPSFVADCLETLEEIAIRSRAAFLAAGGEELKLVPSLNAHVEWARGAAKLVQGANPLV